MLVRTWASELWRTSMNKILDQDEGYQRKILQVTTLYPQNLPSPIILLGGRFSIHNETSSKQSIRIVKSEDIPPIEGSFWTTCMENLSHIVRFLDQIYPRNVLSSVELRYFLNKRPSFWSLRLTTPKPLAFFSFYTVSQATNLPPFLSSFYTVDGINDPRMKLDGLHAIYGN